VVLLVLALVLLAREGRGEETKARVAVIVVAHHDGPGPSLFVEAERAHERNSSSEGLRGHVAERERPRGPLLGVTGGVVETESASSSKE
jgi:hypothetical protein